MSPAKAIATYLQSQSVGTLGATSGWALAYSTEPDAPPNAITIFDTGGPAPDTDQQNVLRPTIQVRVRSTGNAAGYDAAYAKHQAIRDLLINLSGVTMSGIRVACVSMRSDILSIGRDDNDRHVLTANYQLLSGR